MKKTTPLALCAALFLIIPQQVHALDLEGFSEGADRYTYQRVFSLSEAYVNGRLARYGSMATSISQTLVRVRNVGDEGPVAMTGVMRMDYVLDQGRDELRLRTNGIAPANYTVVHEGHTLLNPGKGELVNLAQIVNIHTLGAPPSPLLQIVRKSVTHPAIYSTQGDGYLVFGTIWIFK